MVRNPAADFKNIVSFWLDCLIFGRAGWRNAPHRKPTSWGSSSPPPSPTSTTLACSRWSLRWTCWRPLSSCSASTCCMVLFHQKCGDTHKKNEEFFFEEHQLLDSCDQSLDLFSSAGAKWRVVKRAPGATLCLRPDVERWSRVGTGRPQKIGAVAQRQRSLKPGPAWCSTRRRGHHVRLPCDGRWYACTASGALEIKSQFMMWTHLHNVQRISKQVAAPACLQSTNDVMQRQFSELP